MKIRVNYRALCPYDTTPDGKDCYHWYTEEFTTDAVKITSGGIEIHMQNKEYSWLDIEQVNLITIVD